MKICVVTPLFAIAGVPLAQLRFARALARMGHEVDLLIGRVAAGYTLPALPEVNATVLGKPNVRNMFLPLVGYLRKASPDIVFSAEDHLNVVVLLAALAAGSKAKISGSSRVTPFDTYSDKPLSKRWVLKQLSRALMRRADALTCVSEDMVQQYRQVFPAAPHVCVYNIVDDRISRERMAEPLDDAWVGKGTPLVIAAGRLAPWKGFGDLIAAMEIVRRHSTARLLILGDGPLRAELQERIDTQGLADTVRLVGYVENPLKYFSRADVFVLSSHVEGLPNVLVEAMMCGCTPVSTDCPTGPREVLQAGKYGYLVPMKDPEALAAGILDALQRPIPAATLAEGVLPFEEAAVVRRHFQVLGFQEAASAQGA